MRRALLTSALVLGATTALARTALAQTPDKRKQTTIQTSKDGSVSVQYLNLPWGEKTFSYMESGGNEYYSTRTWPFAHLKLEKDATWADKTLTAGNYVLYITPKSEKTPMTLTVASFTPAHHDSTFLVDVKKAGDGHDIVVHYGDRWLTTHLAEK